MAETKPKSAMIIVHLVWRVLLLLIALATLIMLAYVGARFGSIDSTTRNPVGLAAAAIAIPADFAAFYIFWKHASYMSVVALMDLVVVGLGFGGAAANIVDHWPEINPDLQDELLEHGYYDFDAAPMIVLLVLASTTVISMCMVCCCSRCGRPKKDKKWLEKRRMEEEEQKKMEQEGGKADDPHPEIVGGAEEGNQK